MEYTMSNDFKIKNIEKLKEILAKSWRFINAEDDFTSPGSYQTIELKYDERKDLYYFNEYGVIEGIYPDDISKLKVLINECENEEEQDDAYETVTAFEENYNSFEVFCQEICNILEDGEEIVIKEACVEPPNYINATLTVIRSTGFNVIDFDGMEKIVKAMPFKD